MTPDDRPIRSTPPEPETGGSGVEDEQPPDYVEEPFADLPGPDPEPESEEEPFVPLEEELAAAKPRFRLFRSETLRRVLWAIPWAIFAIVIIVAGGPLFAASMIALGVIGLREFFAMTERARPFPVPAYLTVAGMVIAAFFGSPYQVLLVTACGFPLIFAFAARREMQETITYSIAITMLGVAWMGLGFAHAELLRELPLHGAALLADVLIATIACDTASYAAGRLFGSRKLAPRISPNKTVEGLIGGFVGAMLGFWLAGLYQDWLSGINALQMGVVVGLLAPIGDLFASMIKRDCDIKDTGRLFGPHGGLIDRLDAILFTVVAGYYLAVAFVY